MKIKAPHTHGSWISHPEIKLYSEILYENKNIFKQYPYKYSFIRNLFEREAGFGSSNSPLIVTGHQPEWFHPGVWSKNFLVHQIAMSSGGVALNCVIDSDIPKTLAWTIPKPSGCKIPTAPLLIPFIPFSERSIPWELQKPLSTSFLFNSFSQIIENMKIFGFESMASVAIQQISKIDHSISAARQFSDIRNKVEFKMGLKLIDLFISNICCFSSFIELIRLFFYEVEVAFEEYNQAIADFRLDHEIDQAGRPIPFLEKENDWFETPLWIYSNKFPERSRFWIKVNGDSFDWRSQNAELNGRMPFSDLETFGLCIRKLASCGIFIRPRALLISLFLRVFASDLFVHGLGGALYDEMTDRWIRGWLGIAPPVSMVCSATFRLPFAEPMHSRFEIDELKMRLREFRWHGESLVDTSSDSDLQKSLGLEKSKLIDWSPLDELGMRARCQALKNINKKISNIYSSSVASIYEILDHESEWTREENLLKSREIPWIMHPVSEIKTVMNMLMNEVRV